jgi:glutamine---fructose-6-phosphate transaminase (isomerizing)
MCGIIGYAGRRSAKPLLLRGLEHLQYRGYDSAGLALFEPQGIECIRAVGNLDALKEAAGWNHSRSTTGLGHTRWATHGRVCEGNAHPLTGCELSQIALCLNGIIENFRELQTQLADEGHSFSSETDAEVVVHLIERHYCGDLIEAVQRTCRDIKGHFAFLVMHSDHPELLVGTRLNCPLLLGLGRGETFVASMASAFLRETRRIQLVENGEIVTATPTGAAVLDTAAGIHVQRNVFDVDWSEELLEKDGHATYMLKEIYEQPDVVRRSIGDRIQVDGLPQLDELGLSHDQLRNLERIVIVACGTAYHAGVVGRYVIEEWARVSVEHDIASEWRYRNPVLSQRSLVIGISQSGETADTLAAVELARAAGARTLAITNMAGSQITREVDSVLYMRAGIEIGVAASKTFVAQVSLLYLIALRLAMAREAITDAQVAAILDELRALPDKMAAFLGADHPIEQIARDHFDKRFFLYLGRHLGLPIALEGALKLKELSYIPTEAYAAGEMKHGPIALLDHETPVVVVATDSSVYEKVISNVQEVRARGAHVIAIATDGNEDIQYHADDVIYVPRTMPALQPVLAALPLQLLAYRIAECRGCNVDQPRNLAKTVTVE